MRQRERRRGGLDVLVEAAGVDVGQAGGARGGDPLRQEADLA
jgi:hypothetical protein